MNLNSWFHLSQVPTAIGEACEQDVSSGQTNVTADSELHEDLDAMFKDGLEECFVFFKFW